MPLLLNIYYCVQPFYVLPKIQGCLEIKGITALEFLFYSHLHCQESSVFTEIWMYYKFFFFCIFILYVRNRGKSITLQPFIIYFFSSRHKSKNVASLLKLKLKYYIWHGKKYFCLCNLELLHFVSVSNLLYLHLFVHPSRKCWSSLCPGCCCLH